MILRIFDISSKRELIAEAAEWFSDQWGIPREVYENSMIESCGENAVPRWYRERLP